MSSAFRYARITIGIVGTRWTLLVRGNSRRSTELISMR